MGRFSLTFILLATGCIDRGIEAPTDEAGSNPPGSPVLSADEVTGRPKPFACASGGFAASNAVGMNISLAQTDGSAALLGVPSGGGTLLGYTVQNGQQVGEAKKLRADDQIVATSAMYVEDYVVAASVTTDGAVFVDRVSSDLSRVTAIAKVEGTAIAKLPLLATHGHHILPTTDALGMHLTTFDASWTMVGSQLFESPKPPTGITGGTLHGDALIAWSAAQTCNLHVASGGTITSMSQPFACANPRMAIDAARGVGLVVFDSPEGVKYTTVAHGTLGPARLLRGDVASPRIAFDGERFWVSFVDLRGQVIVGYLDTTTMDLTSVALPGMRPERDGFELAIVDERPWVYAADADGFAAHRMCVD